MFSADVFFAKHDFPPKNGTVPNTALSVGHGPKSGNDLARGSAGGHNAFCRCPTPEPKPDPYAPWRRRDYRYYAGSWFVMTFSKQIETLAVSVYFVEIYSRTEAPLALGLMALVQALPVMLLAIAGGHLADRFDRRHVLMITLSLGMAASAGLLAVALLGGSVAWIYILLGVGAAGQALGSPSRAALLPAPCAD